MLQFHQRKEIQSRQQGLVFGGYSIQIIGSNLVHQIKSPWRDRSTYEWMLKSINQSYSEYQEKVMTATQISPKNP